MVDPPRSEREIIEGCRAGDPDATVAFVVLHQRALVRVVGRLVGRWGVTEDVVQETFIRAFEHMERIDARRGAGGWLLKTALNLCRDRLREGAFREVPDRIDEEAHPVLTHEPSRPDALLVGRELGQRLEKAIDRLSPKLREVMVLHHVEGLPLREIAALVGTPTSVLKVRALRARARLRALVAEEYT